MNPQILAIGQHKDSAGSLNKIAVDNSVKMLQVDSVEQAITLLCDGGIEMAFVDTSSCELPDVFTGLNENRINLPIVAVGPAQPVQNAVKAIRLGAIEYLSTPLDNELVNSLLDKVKPSEDIGLIYGDPKTQELVNQAKQFAQSNATILLRGESGTGKEVFSKFVHSCSGRSDKSFISVNCAAIPENLLESELFGHEKGAFSGALQKRLGKFQQADKGTLLLDEISEMDLSLQAKLLRAIQERVIDPVGSTQPVSVDIRLIATTNRELEEYVAEGQFREDLYFRLNVVALEIPPLRERPGDIMPLAEFFANMYGDQNGLKDIEIAKDTKVKLEGCYWKGNVRELENTIHRAVLMMDSNNNMLPQHIVISPMSLKMMEVDGTSEVTVTAPIPTPTQPTANPAASAYASAAGGFSAGTGANKQAIVGRKVQDVEKELILNTLDYCKGNRTHAAEVLGISIRTLRNKLKEYQESGDYVPQGDSVSASAPK